MVLHAILAKNEGLTRLPNMTIAKLNNLYKENKQAKIQDRESTSNLWTQYSKKKQLNTLDTETQAQLNLLQPSLHPNTKLISPTEAKGRQ